ncbi:MAG: hypothetical protein NTX64_08595 [Elusimicrobia bacterium]|nr:hypothetical protein [Elusimicrobiota bacterium]
MNLSRNIDTAPWFRALRWLLVLPAAVVGFYTAFILSLFTFKLLNGWCPGGKVISGMCTVSWVNFAPMVVGVVAAPSLVIVFGTLMAPSQRIRTAWALYAAGLIAAIGPFRAFGKLLIPVALVGAGIASVMQTRFKMQKAAHNIG